MKISTALTVAFAASSSAATCPVAIVDTLKTLVDTTNNLKVTVAALTATNIAANGGAVVQGITNIATSQAGLIATINAASSGGVGAGVSKRDGNALRTFLASRQVITTPCDATSQTDICNMITNFAVAEQGLVDTLVSKSSILGGLKVTLVPAVKTLEQNVLAFANPLLPLLPECAATASQQLSVLDTGLQADIKILAPATTFTTTLLPQSGAGATCTASPVTVTVTKTAQATSTCTQVQPSAQDKTLVCGVPGNFTAPAVAGTTVATSVNGCADSCAKLKETNGALTCFGFGYAASTKQCRLFYRAPVFMGFKADASNPESIYNIQCFRTSC